LQAHSGEIGTLFQNGQIGGFFNWEIEYALKPAGCDKWASYSLGLWKCTASRYWLLEKPTGRIFKAVFYQMVKDKLVVLNEVQVNIELPNLDLNHIHNIPLIMTWMN